MNIIYAQRPFVPCNFSRSIFLAGPTPRTPEVASWRPESIELFRKLNFSGTLMVPEDETGGMSGDYLKQIEWEDEGLTKAACIMFWIPRRLDTLPGFTTNVEFGRWMESGKCILGYPPEAVKVKYLGYYAKRLRIPTFHSLEKTVTAAIQALG
jgi:hypothetical protein